MGKIEYTKVLYKYKLHKDYKVRLDKRFKEDKSIDGFIVLQKDGLLKIKKGYCWDGPSGPTIDTPSFMRGSLVHDALYQLMRSGILSLDYRDWADRWLKIICLEDGMYSWRAWYVYNAVKNFSEEYAKPQSIEIHTAP